MEKKKQILTSNHISEYANYGLEAIFMESKTIVSEIDFENQIVTDVHNESMLIKDIVPLLYPLSYLTKEIKYLESELVPAKVLFPISREEEEMFDLYGEVPEVWNDFISQIPNQTDYITMKYLFEWQIDVFGLIESGLAKSICD